MLLSGSLRKFTILAALASFAVSSDAAHLYRFSFKLQGKSRGRFLLLFPYRVYFETGGAAVFRSDGSENGVIRFKLERIDSPGYLMRTLNFSGRKLGVFAADIDSEQASDFAREKMSEFNAKAPSMVPAVKKRFLFPYRILSPQSETITFSLHPGGITSDPVVLLKKESVGDHEGDNHYFFVYRMMMEILGLYNHSCFPENGQKIRLEELLENPEAVQPDPESFSWKGSPLQLSEKLTRIGGLMASIIKKHVRVEQRDAFELLYKVKEWDDQILSIQGSATPDVKVYGGFKITHFRRDVRIRRQDGAILEDSLYVEIRNRKGRGGFADAKLVRIGDLD